MSIRIEDLATTDFSGVTEGSAQVEPTRPGDILLHDFMEPLGLSANALARALKVPANRITAILNGRRSVTADTALRLSRYFGTTPEFWINLQARHELLLAREQLGDGLSEIAPRDEAA